LIASQGFARRKAITFQDRRFQDGKRQTPKREARMTNGASIKIEK
jgi:hypothetical protein